MTKDELFMEIDNERKLELWNEWCEEMNNCDDIVYVNDEDFLQMAFANDLWKMAVAIANGDYKTTHDYVKFDAYGCLKSYYSIYHVIADVCDCNDEFIEYAIENYNK